MAGPNGVLDKGFLAESEVREYRAVKFADTTNDDQSVVECDADGELAIGVAQEQAWEEDRDVGKRVINVRMMGITWMVASTSDISQGSKVSTTVNGRARVATAGDPVVGLATMGADDEGDLIAVLLTPGVVAS